MVVSVALPNHPAKERRGIYERTTRGLRLYLATPRLRGLLALCLTVSAAGAMVIVNTVVFVQAELGLTQTDTALALAAFGCGSMFAALSLPRLLDRIADRPVMLSGAAMLIAGLVLTAFVSNYPLLLAVWLVMGLGYSIVQTPSGRLLRRSAHAEDRPALFAAHFALSHAAWLLTYPLAGWLGATIGLPLTAIILAIIAGLGLVCAVLLWRAYDEVEVEHSHDDLAENDPHLMEGHHRHGHRHSHAFMIDRLHPEWPREH
jgi:predicted MFS family arabinose efflux permease